MPATPVGALRPAAPARRPLPELVAAVPGLLGDGDLTGVELTGCTHDSRAVQPGDLYAALPGAHAHGADFADAAVAAGAVAVLTDPEGAARGRRLNRRQGAQCGGGRHRLRSQSGGCLRRLSLRRRSQHAQGCQGNQSSAAKQAGMEEHLGRGWGSRVD